MSASSGSRLTVFSFDYPPYDGGIARLCSNLVSSLQLEGIETTVLTHRVKSTGEGPDRPAVSTRTVPALRGLGDVLALAKIRAQRRVPVLASNWYPEGLIARLSGVRCLVVLAHGAEIFPPSDSLRRWWWPRLERSILESAVVVVCNSQYTAKLVRSFAPEARLEVVPLAVDEERFLPGDRDLARHNWGWPKHSKVVLSVSRLLRYKGHDTVIEAIARLPSERRKSLIYVIAGKGKAEHELRRLASDLDVAENVFWLGFVPDEDLPSLYRAADLFVLCTREEPGIRAVEGFGLVFLEAQSCGVPAVGTACGGIPDAVEEGNGGWLVPPGDPKELSRLLGRLIASPGEVLEMGHRARKRVLNGFTWHHYARRLLAALERRGVVTSG